LNFAEIDLSPVTTGVASLRDGVLGAATVAISAALSLLLIAWGGRYLVKLFKSATDEGRWTAEDHTEYERQGREVELHNNMNGMAPGWGAFHGQRGSGLRRGRR
jgi:hypothetical protein